MASCSLNLILMLMIFSTSSLSVLAEEHKKEEAKIKRLSMDEMMSIEEETDRKEYRASQSNHTRHKEQNNDIEKDDTSKKEVVSEPVYKPVRIKLRPNPEFERNIPATKIIKAQLVTPLSSQYSGIGTAKVRYQYRDDQFGTITMHLLGKYFVVKDSNRIQIQFTQIQHQNGEIDSMKGHAIEMSDELPGIIGRINRRPMKRIGEIANMILEDRFLSFTQNNDIDRMTKPSSQGNIQLETHNIVSVTKGHPIMVFLDQPLSIQRNIKNQQRRYRYDHY